LSRRAVFALTALACLGASERRDYLRAHREWTPAKLIAWGERIGVAPQAQGRVGRGARRGEQARIGRVLVAGPVGRAWPVEGFEEAERVVDIGDPKALREYADQLRDKLAPSVVLLGSPTADGQKALLACSVSQDAIARIKAGNAGLSLAGSAVASDAFFPFRDGLDVVIDEGARCVIQPGGSMRDDEVIAAADERGVAMVFTGTRHFRH